MTRALVRAELLAQRRALGAGQISSLSKQVTERFAQSCGIPAEAWKGLLVGLYRPLQGELEPYGLERFLRDRGAELCFPRVIDTQKRVMELARGGRGPGAAESWRKGPYGNEEPALQSPAIDPAQLDIIFVPGVAFGLQGERFGMGSGFYDRYLPQAARALRIALAFDFQLLPKLEQGSWDQRVDWIWTERRQIQLRAWSPS